ncbi:MAG: hypothetical protein JXD19_01355 [Deltaproteobacteria bacterium]|nr:hypothetical protein [Deltaproteobacteria bacterium]
MIAKFLAGWLFVVWGLLGFLCAVFEMISLRFPPLSTAGIGYLIVAQLGAITIWLGFHFVMDE